MLGGSDRLLSGLGHTSGVGAVGIHHVEFGAAVAVRSEGYLLAVGRPRSGAVVALVVGHAHEVTTVGSYDPDGLTPVLFRGEDDLFPVRGPLRQVVCVLVVGYAGHVAAIGVHEVDLVVPVPVRGEGDAVTGGGPVGRPVYKDRRAGATCLSQGLGRVLVVGVVGFGYFQDVDVVCPGASVLAVRSVARRSRTCRWCCPGQ